MEKILKFSGYTLILCYCIPFCVSSQVVSLSNVTRYLLCLFCIKPSAYVSPLSHCAF